MSGINFSSLSRDNMGVILEDLRVQLAIYYEFEQYGAMHVELAEKGVVDVWATPAGVPSQGHRKNKVAIGAPLPKGSLAFEQRNYEVERYGKEYPVDRALLRRLESMTDIRDQLASLAAKDALMDFLLDVKPIFDGTSTTTGKQFTTLSLTAGGWQLPTSDVIEDVNQAVASLGGGRNGDTASNAVGGGGIVAVLGLDVAQKLMKHPQITGSAAGSGRELVGFDAVRDFMRMLNVSEVWIDGATTQSTEANYDRDYENILNGVAAFYWKNNLNWIVQEEFQMDFDTDYNKSTKMWSFLAETRRDVIVGHRAHGCLYQNVLTTAAP